ncbi:glutaredoxin [Aeromonas phage Riv-10]|nr:glutaredoxin [Aeromonas phage Riv-10]
MIEIYGIVSETSRCPACDVITKRLDEDDIDYTVKTVLRDAETELGFEYDRAVINELRDRINQPKGALSLPKVFVNGAFIGGAQALLDYLDN